MPRSSTHSWRRRHHDVAAHHNERDRAGQEPGWAGPRRPIRRRIGRTEAAHLWSIHQATREAAPPRAAEGHRRGRCRRPQRHPHLARTQNPRASDRHHLLRRRRRLPPRGHDEGAGNRFGPGAGPGSARRHAERSRPDSRRGHRLHGAAQHTHPRARPLRALSAPRVPPGLLPQRRGPAHRVANALRGRGQDQSPAFELLRPRAPR